MTKHTGRGYAVRADQGGPIVFLASTDALVKQDGMVIERGAWRFDRYRKNPVILFGHDYMGQRLPIGKATKYAEDSRGLIVDAEFDQDDPFAREVERKLRKGYLNGVSISWDVLRIDGNRVKEAELIEVSVVPIPADANAVAIARGAYRGSSSDDDWWKGFARIGDTGTRKRSSPPLSKDERLAAMFMALPKERQERVFRTFTESEKNRLIRAIKTARQSDTVLVVHGRFLNTLADVAKEKGLLR